MDKPRDIELETRQGRQAALAWQHDGAPRVLCLHGWLDNAASFLPLAARFEGCDLVALDLPGHGHSDHRHPSARYHFIDYLFDVDAALDALGWKDCHVLGHSLGAAIAAKVRSPEMVGMLSMFWLFPLMLASTAFAPAESMPGWLQGFATYQPISVAADAVRGLANGTPAGADVLAALACSWRWRSSTRARDTTGATRSCSAAQA